MNLAKHKGVAIIHGDNEYTYHDIIDQVAKYKGMLPGSGLPFILQSDYSLKSICLLIALHQLGRVSVPIVPSVKSEDDYKIKVALSETYNAPCVVLFTSGTTGVPKIVKHSLDNLIARLREPRRQKRLNILLFLMFDHIGGINTLFSCLNNGSCAVITEDRNPETILQIIQDKQINILPTTPTFLNLLLQVENFNNYDISSLRLITYGTERMPQALLNKIRNMIPNARMLQTFGTSESGIVRTESKSSDSLFFKILDDHSIIDGNLFINGLQTGDIVEVDNDGYIKVIGRNSDIINVGGLKVMPAEVENVINEYPGVIDSTAYGIDNAITGQAVGVSIVCNGDITKNDIRNWCDDRLSRYKIPVKIIFKDVVKHTNRFKKA